MADIRIKYPIVWVFFLAFMFVGAGLMLSQDSARVAIGVSMFLAPIVLLSLVLAGYYWKSRREA